MATKKATRKKTTSKSAPTKSDLMEEAQDLDVEGRSTMGKAELADAVEEARDEESPNPRASDEAKEAAKRGGEDAEKKRADAEERLSEQRADSLDRDDPSLGWDVRQGTLARFEDGPRKYPKEQLPDPEVLREAGYEPVMPESQIIDE